MDEQPVPPIPAIDNTNLPPVVLDTDAEKRMHLMLIAGGVLVILIGIAGIYLLAADPTSDTADTSKMIVTENSDAPVPIPAAVSAPTPLVSGAGVMPLRAAKFGIPLTKETLAFDFNGDKVLDISDLTAISQFADQHQYAAVYDVDSNNIVDRNDVYEVRMAMSGHPEVEFDLNGDHVLDISDVVAVSQFVDQHQYANIYDFNADGIIDVKDVAMIRTAISQAGSVDEDPALQRI